MSNAVVVPKLTSNSVIMVPVKPPQTRLVTGQTKEIYVPLASKYNFGIVKIGDGLIINSGVISFDDAKISIKSISKNGVIIPPDKNRNVNLELNRNDVGLGFVDNVADIDKPISILQNLEFAKKLDIQQNKDDAGKILYINNKGKIDFRNDETKLNVLTQSVVVSNSADTLNFSDDFDIAGNTEISVKLSSILKQTISKMDTDLSKAVVSVKLNESDGKLTFIKRDGTELVVDTLLEKIVTNFAYDENNKELVLSLKDGTEQRIPMTAFIDDYSGVDGDVISVYVTADNKIGALLKNGVIAESKLNSQLIAKLNSFLTPTEADDNYLSFTNSKQTLTATQKQQLRNKIGAGSFDGVEYVEKPKKSTNQQVITMKSDGSTEGIALASNTDAAIFGTIPRYQNPIYYDADTPPQNMGNLVAADPTKPLHVVNKRFVEDNYVKMTNAALKLYGTDSKGNQVEWIFRNTNNTKNTVAGRDSNGNVQVGTAVNPTDAINKQYAEDNFLEKVTGTSSYQQLYAKNINGTQGMINLSSSTVGSTIVQRQSNGHILVPQGPASPSDAASKKYVDDKFNGASKPETYETYSDMITALNSMDAVTLARGLDVNIVQTGVPDLWVAYVEEDSVTYTYVDDDSFINELITNGTVQVGYYKLGYRETQKVDLADYAKTADVDKKLDRQETTLDCVYAYSISKKQQVMAVVDAGNGLALLANGSLIVSPATQAQIDKKTDARKPLTCTMIDYAVKKALSDCKLSQTDPTLDWTDDEKLNARELLGVVVPEIIVMEDE